jgi:NAD-dependent dihydropyrimidine dehydrogenase PreA subunit
MNKDEALKLALVALEEWYFGCGAGSISHDDAVEAIKQALAQPAVQEGRDWSLLAATQESLREHMAEIKRLKAAQPEQQLMEKAYLAGFLASADGYNGQCPFDQCGQEIESDEDWCIDRDDALRQLLEQQEQEPVQDLPFGVGGGLVAIKTLLGRDPCVHANTAIEMIDAILKEHPAAQPDVQEKCFLCGERVASCTSDVCPKSAQPAVIQQMVDALDHADELLGGNDTLVMNGAAAGRWLLEQPAVQEGRDWSLLEATQESLREHMAEIVRLKAALPVPVQHDECVVCGDKVRVIPRPWVGLTETEVEAYDSWADFQVGCGRQTLFDMVRDIEAKLKEKNT